jgi:formamidopyrimidine-DNA glycosylase
MPELPEAETIARTLAPDIEGRRIVAVKFFTDRVHRWSKPRVAGRTIRRVRRYGKLVVLELDRGYLRIHLGMTGRLLLESRPSSYTRVLLALDKGALCFDDIRQFGFVRWSDRAPDNLGPDPLELPFEEFAVLLRGRRGAVKPLLLNQSFLRGLGNIYADEILFRARVHPCASAARLSQQRARRLHSAMQQVLNQAIASGGSSISNYVDANGRKGTFQLLHQVYRKTAQPCPSCTAPIRRMVVAQRGTHYCPQCQKV